MIKETTLTEKGFSLDISVSRDSQKMDVSKRDLNIGMVKMNHSYWNKESNFLSCNNFNNADFKRIVSMGEDAVPGILEIIQDHPDPVVHALDLIYPDYMVYEGYVSLEDVCRTWIITLKLLGKA